MKNKDCNIIQDLLPNYIENLTSENTNKFIEAHIEGCKTCEEILENMKTDLKQKPKPEKREIKYAKKVALKLKVLRIFIIIIVIAIIAFVANTARKYLILRKLDELSKTYVNSKSENYRLVVYSNDMTKDKKFEKCEYTRFKNKTLRINTSCESDSNNSYISKDILYFDSDEEIFIVDVNGKNVNGYIKRNVKEYDYYNYPTTFNDELKWLDKEDKSGFKGLKNIIISNIKEEEFDGTMCYVITFEDRKMYFEKHTGLLRKAYNQYGYFLEYYYDFNCLNDESIKKPDTSGITLEERN